MPATPASGTHAELRHGYTLTQGEMTRMACESFARSEDHPNKCANCGEWVSAHIDTSPPDDE